MKKQQKNSNDVLGAKVVALRKKGHSFRAIEKMMARELGLDPKAETYKGWTSFHLYAKTMKAAGKTRKVSKKSAAYNGWAAMQASRQAEREAEASKASKSKASKKSKAA